MSGSTPVLTMTDARQADATRTDDQQGVVRPDLPHLLQGAVGREARARTGTGLLLREVAVVEHVPGVRYHHVVGEAAVAVDAQGTRAVAQMIQRCAITTTTCASTLLIDR